MEPPSRATVRAPGRRWDSSVELVESNLRQWDLEDATRDPAASDAQSPRPSARSTGSTSAAIAWSRRSTPPSTRASTSRHRPAGHRESRHGPGPAVGTRDQARPHRRGVAGPELRRAARAVEPRSPRWRRVGLLPGRAAGRNEAVPPYEYLKLYVDGPSARPPERSVKAVPAPVETAQHAATDDSQVGDAKRGRRVGRPNGGSAARVDQVQARRAVDRDSGRAKRGHGDTAGPPRDVVGQRAPLEACRRTDRRPRTRRHRAAPSRSRRPRARSAQRPTAVPHASDGRDPKPDLGLPPGGPRRSPRSGASARLPVAADGDQRPAGRRDDAERGDLAAVLGRYLHRKLGVARDRMKRRRDTSTRCALRARPRADQAPAPRPFARRRRRTTTGQRARPGRRRSPLEQVHAPKRRKHPEVVQDDETAKLRARREWRARRGRTVRARPRPETAWSRRRPAGGARGRRRRRCGRGCSSTPDRQGRRRGRFPPAGWCAPRRRRRRRPSAIEEPAITGAPGAGYRVLRVHVREAGRPRRAAPRRGPEASKADLLVVGVARLGSEARVRARAPRSAAQCGHVRT